MKKTVVTWQESQNLMEKKGFIKHCVLINSEKGLELYGSAAYLVDEKWLKKVEQGLIPDSDEDEGELMVDYSFPEDDNYDD